MRVSGLVSLLLVAFLLASATPVMAAVSPKVSTSSQTKFSRIGFDWPKNVRFKETTNGNTTTLTFSEPATIDVGAIRNSLGKRVTGASLSKDGKSLKLTFDQPYRIRHFISGNKNGIDILGTDAPVNSKAKPEAKPEDKAETKPEKKADKAADKKVDAKKDKKADKKKDDKKSDKKDEKKADKKADKKAESKKQDAPKEQSKKAEAKRATTPEPKATAAPTAKVEAKSVEPAKPANANLPPPTPEPAPAAPAPTAQERISEAVAQVAAGTPAKAKMDPKAIAKAAKAAATAALAQPATQTTAQPPAAPAVPEAPAEPAAAEQTLPATPPPAPAAPAAPAVPETAPTQAEAAPTATGIEQPDVAAEPEPAAAQQPAPVAQEAAAAPATAPAEQPTTAIPAAAESTPVAAPSEAPPPPAAAPEQAASAPLPPDDEAPQDAGSTKQPPLAAGEQMVTNPEDEAPAVKTGPAPIPNIEAIAPQNTTAPSDATPEEKANAAAAANPQAQTAPIEAKGSVQTEDVSGGKGGPFLITTRALPNGIEIQFPWKERTAAAIFRRANDIWVVFDTEKELNLSILESIMPASVYKVKAVPFPGHSILHFETDGSLYAQVRRPKNSQEWHVTLSPFRQIPGSPVSLELKPNAVIPSIAISVQQYAKPITVKDPLIGDQLLIVPLYEVGQGSYPTRDFVEMTMLETAQGLAAVKKSDTAAIAPVRGGLRLTSNTGLTLSPNMPALSLEELDNMKNKYATLFPYEKWKIDPDKFVESRRELEQKMVGASPVRLSSLRQKLAEMYLGLGMGQEALALINLIRSDDIGYYYQNQLSSERGVANFLIHRYGEAIADFNARDLVEDPEIKMWREALAIFQQDRPRFDYHLYYDNYINKYPPRLRERLAVLAADNYINRRNYQRAFTTFDSLNKTGISAETMPYVNFLIGKIAAEQGRNDQAIALWKPLIDDSDDRFIRARAEFAMVTLLYNSGRMDGKEALRRLDNLRIVWRGDAFEISLLNYLGQMYVDQHDPLNGMRCWRELITNFPESGIAIDVARAMATTFNKLFAEGEADKMKPLEALTTFYEFRDLVPIGTAGDKMIQSLADRLASVDLLDRAAGLLEHQIQYRQEGEMRSKLGAQLALIYVLNHEPQKALDALELTGYGKNPTELQHKRLQLTSMALNGLKEYERALEMLRQDESPEAKELRMDIYWNKGDWSNVITVAEQILSERKDITAPLSGIENAQLLKLALAYIFNHQASQLEYLRNFYLPLVQDETAKRVFAFITDAATPIDPKKFDEVISHANEVAGFMQEFKDKISKGGLSEAIK